MDDPPYTTPEEDPFNVRPLVQPYPRRRKSSMLDKWIQEQQRYTSPEDPSTSDSLTHSRSHSSPTTHAYLAYPELNRSFLDRAGPSEGAASENGYDLVDDDDIPPSLAAEFLNMKVTDTHATIRANRRNSRMSLSPTSFRHFNLVFRSPSSNSQVEDSPSRPSSRISLFSRSNRTSSGTITSRGTITPHTTPQKSSSRSSQIFTNINNTTSSHPSPSPRTPPRGTAAARSSSSSKWRPSVLGHFTPSSHAHAASQSSIHPPPSDSNYTPSRPSVSSSVDTSHAHTSLTVPSAEGSASHCSPTHSSPSASELKQGSPQSTRHVGSVRSRRSTKRYSTPTSQHSRYYSQEIGVNSISGASSISSRSQAYPSSVNTNTNIHDLFSSDRDFASPSPTLSSNTGRGYNPQGTFSRMYPFIYNNGVQTSARRGANAFDGIHSAYNFRECAEEGEDDDVEGGGHRRVDAQQQPQHREQAKKKKPHVVYSSQNGGTLSRMTSFSNLALSRSKRKKKKLVVSGVAVNDTRRFEGVKRWCESFGEVRQILRMPNGDLVVSFQSAEVADTVCRVRAKVFINGVGSVQLSWTTEKKR